MLREDIRSASELRDAARIAVTYLTMDEIASGVGASQVLPYVEGLAKRGAQMTVHSFEHESAPFEIRQRLEAAGVAWHAHPFHNHGSIAGGARVIQGAALVRGATMVHARSDLPAAAALAARPRAWVWDVRSFWADQRIAMGMLRRGSPQERVLRKIEASAAKRSSAITTLTAAAIDVLARRHGEAVRAKATVIPTCVDLERFALAQMPHAEPLRLLLSGSFNHLYDLDLTLRFVDAVRRMRHADLTLLRPQPCPWDSRVVDFGGSLTTARYAEMPAHLRESHAGLCICRTDEPDAISAAMPTKLAEFLATGRPVVVNAGLGDMDRLVARHRCGVTLRDGSREATDEAARRLFVLIDDDQTPARCRTAAAEHFDLEQGVSDLLGVYGRALRPWT